MDVAMHYVGSFGRLLALTDEQYALPAGATLAELIAAIHARHAALPPDVFLGADGGFAASVVFLVAGSACRRPDAPLADGGEVSVLALTPTVGG